MSKSQADMLGRIIVGSILIAVSACRDTSYDVPPFMAQLTDEQRLSVQCIALANVELKRSPNPGDPDYNLKMEGSVGATFDAELERQRFRERYPGEDLITLVSKTEDVIPDPLDEHWRNVEAACESKQTS